jgi:hypothetical protein
MFGIRYNLCIVRMCRWLSKQAECNSSNAEVPLNGEVLHSMSGICIPWKLPLQLVQF